MTGIAVVGDIFIQDALPTSSQIEAVSGLLQAADIVFGNLETPVSERGIPVEKWINHRMPERYLEDIRTMGFDILSIANNHMLDYGRDAFFDTLELVPQYTMRTVGGGHNLDEAWQASVVTAGDTRIAFLGASSTLPPGSAADIDHPGIAPIHIFESYNVDYAASMEQPGSAPYVFTRASEHDIQRAEQAIKQAKDHADFVVVAIHWGVPPVWRPRFQDGLADYQPEVGHALIDAGADLIVGHHPHSLQAVEIYKGKAIFYSLGNFVFHRNRYGRTDTVISQNAPYRYAGNRDRTWSESLIVFAHFNAGSGVRYTLHPVLLDDDGNPGLVRDEESVAILKRFISMSEDITMEIEDGIGTFVII